MNAFMRVWRPCWVNAHLIDATQCAFIRATCCGPMRRIIAEYEPIYVETRPLEPYIHYVRVQSSSIFVACKKVE